MPKILPPLTASKVAAAASRKAKGRFLLRDGACPGLSFQGGPMGAVWARYTTVLGKRSHVILGTYPQMGLQEAREAARAALSPSDRVTLTGLLDRYEAADAPKTWPEARKRIESVFAALLDAPCHRLTVAALQRAVDGHTSRSSAGAAVRYIRPVLKWARRRQLTDMVPSDLAEPRGALQKRDRVLTEDEIRGVLLHLGDTPFDEAVRLLMLTATRLMEVCRSTPEEFDTTHKIWTIPGDRRKNGLHLVVPLTDDAIEVVKRFQARRWAWPISNWDRWQKRFHAKTQTSGWHRHDLRRTAATTLGPLGVPPHVVEMVLGHANAYSELNGVYNQYRYAPEHREALELLAGYYRKLLT